MNEKKQGKRKKRGKNQDDDENCSEVNEED